MDSIWLLIKSWLTPAVFFVLLNLVIGTIALTSKSLLAHRRPNEPAAFEGYFIARTASSALHRLRSLSLVRLRSGDFFSESAIAAAAAVQNISNEISNVSSETKVSEMEEEHRLSRSQSETRPVAEGESMATMTKSASERPALGLLEKEKAVKTEKGAEEEEAEDGVDARADDFINRFRQQLHLQRLNSLLKYKVSSVAEDKKKINK